MEEQKDIRKTVLSQLKIPGETREFFEELTIPIIIEWAYLCMTEGMPLETLKRVCAAAETNTKKASLVFMEERERNLRKRYENNEELKDQYTDLLHRVEIMYERASAVEEGVNGKLAEAIRGKDQAFAQTIQMKDVVIREKEKQAAALREDLSGMKKEIADLKAENRELLQKYDGEREKVYSLEDRLRTAKTRLSLAADGKEKTASEGEKKGPSAVALGRSTGGDANGGSGHGSKEEKIRVFPYSRYSYPMKQAWNWRSFFHREEREADEFIRLYIDNKEFSKEQKEYLIECLEQGDPLHVIKKFASPGLSVSYMDQMRRIIYERGY